MRRKHIVLAGELSGWPKGTTPSPADMIRLDQYSSELVNGDEGGTWAPEDPIVLGPYPDPKGTLTPTVDLTTSGSVLSGDVETVLGNSKAGSVLNQSGLVLEGGALPTLQSSITRSVVIPFIGFIESTSATRGFREHFEVAPLLLGCRGIYQKVVSDLEFTIAQLEPSTSQIVSVPFPVRAQHRASTITSVVFRVLIVGQYSAVPATAMKFRVVRVRGDSYAALHSNGGGYDASGWFADTAATVAQYTNNGQVRSFTYTPDQNNTALDPTQDYFMMQARASSDFRNSVFLSAVVNLSTIADLRQE